MRSNQQSHRFIERFDATSRKNDLYLDPLPQFAKDFFNAEDFVHFFLYMGSYFLDCRL